MSNRTTEMANVMMGNFLLWAEEKPSCLYLKGEDLIGFARCEGTMEVISWKEYSGFATMGEVLRAHPDIPHLSIDKFG